ncbi:N-acetylglucosamine-6-phosphate deacetylase [Vibrio sp.]|nr:N-acetylglucosamine-6-phosphate deacetylase [Vibrio sp.]
MLALTNGIVFTGFDTLHNKAVLVENDTIVDIIDETGIPGSAEIFDTHGQWICAGFIDLQLNGCGGIMFNDKPDVATLEHMHQVNLKSGTTSFLPTLISDSDNTIRLGIEACKRYMSQHKHQVLGMHLEGPYTNPKRKGIHPEAQLRQPNEEMISWLAEQSQWLKKVTLAPEMNKEEHIKQLVDAGIIVSIGHTAATYDQARRAIENGVSFATHLYNAMSPTSSGREPGVVGAVLDAQHIYAGIIADGYHVHWANIRIAKSIMQERLCLVTDATAGANAPKDMSSFDFCGSKILIQNGKCVDENGTLGGSALTMDEGVRLLVENANIAKEEAIRMATLYPAKAIGVDNSLGQIKPGYTANLIVMNQDYKVSASIVNGVIMRN